MLKGEWLAKQSETREVFSVARVAKQHSIWRWAGTMTPQNQCRLQGGPRMLNEHRPALVALTGGRGDIYDNSSRASHFGRYDPRQFKVLETGVCGFSFQAWCKCKRSLLKILVRGLDDRFNCSDRCIDSLDGVAKLRTRQERTKKPSFVER